MNIIKVNYFYDNLKTVSLYKHPTKNNLVMPASVIVERDGVSVKTSSAR